MSEKNKYFPVHSMKFWGAFLIHMRPYLLFVSGAAGLAGMAISPGNEKDISIFLLAFIPFFLGYGFGQALTDCFQIDTDSISAPYRPLVKGYVSPKAVGIVSLLGLLLISISLIYLNLWNILWGGMSIIGLATYTYFKKRFWFAGPPYNGWIVMLLPVMGYMALSDVGLSGLKDENLLVLAVMTLFSYANFVLIGYLKDISADKETNYRVFPVVFGWDKTVFVGDINVLVSVTACYWLIGYQDLYAFSAFALATLIAIAGQLYGHFTSNKSESSATFPVAATVRSFILWHLAVSIYFRPDWFLFSIIFYLCYEITLFVRPAKGQI
jgi:4-hydroxybenzoate polyprenyltransferase